jgi:biotin carboxylase
VKKALIHIGASKLQENSLKWAKESGLYVVATDINANPPSKYIADEFYNISGTNVNSLLDLAKTISKNFNLTGVYCNSDFSLAAAAQINKKYGLRGCRPDSVKLSIDKNAAKEMMLKNNISVPQGVTVDDNSLNISNLTHLQFPLIIKPLDSSGSQGVMYVNNHKEIKNAIDHALKFSKKALIEEFIPGDGVDTIGIMRDGKLFPCGLGLRFFSDLPFRFPTHGYTSNALSRSDQENAYRITEEAANAVGISDGPVKADLLFYKRKFTVIEVTPRFHGDVFTNKTLIYATDFNPTKELLSFLTTGKFSDKSILDIKPKLILWKGLFPLVDNIDWPAIKNDTDIGGKILDLYLDPRYKFKNCIHTDNTTLSGFIFLEFDDINKINLFLKKFKFKYDGILI